MLLVLTVALSLLSVAQSCSPLVSREKVLRTFLSVHNGAHYLKSRKEYNATRCFAGCCTLKDCDTVMHTGTKLTKKGTNCFFFKCDGHCLFNSSTSNNIQVATFPLYTSPLPEIHGETKPSFEPKENATIVLDGSATSDTGYQIGKDTDVKDTTNNKTPPDTQPDTQKSSSVISSPVIVSNTTVHVNTTKPSETSPDENVEVIPENKPDQTVIIKPEPEVVTEAKEEDGKEELKKEETENEEPKKAEPKKAEPKKEQPKKEEPKTEEPKKEEPEKEEPKKEEPAAKDTQSVKDKLPNEVPAVLKPTVNESGEGDNNLKIEVDIINHEDKVQAGLVFWVALALGAGLVSFGLITVCRCYTKKRRLYSALADDYLINGMYSI